VKTGLEYAVRRVRHGESELVSQLLRVSEKHEQEAEVHFVTRDLAEWSRLNLAALAEVASRYEIDVDAEPDEPGRLRHAVDALAAKTPGRVAGVALLEDLRDLFLVASETSLAWEMLAQHAKARREHDLLDLVSKCHPQTLRQLRWINTTIKVTSPQVLASMDA
jgi:hypothetical protein